MVSDVWYYLTFLFLYISMYICMLVCIYVSIQVVLCHMLLDVMLSLVGTCDLINLLASVASLPLVITL